MVAKFKKWKKFENHYNEKFIYFYVKNIPDLDSFKFQIQEKIDGANFSFLFAPLQEISYYKRSGNADRNFFNFRRIFQDPELCLFIEAVQNYIDMLSDDTESIQIIGELYGTGIQRRINYGEKIYWKWFGIYKNEELISLEEEEEMRKQIGEIFWNFRVPIIDDNVTLKEFINYPIEGVKSKIAADDLIEGICCRNHGAPIKFKDDYMLLKKKTQQFQENKGIMRKPPKQELTSEFQVFIDQVMAYVNPNRTASLLSKEGPLDDMKKFGDYMRAYVNDVYDDFNKENDNKLDYLEQSSEKLVRRIVSNSIRYELLAAYNKA